ncbi:hypothetical protein MMC13_006221 [Lambiella insularis]|nr:hypothetical protein [Lambiella insularis]
MSADQFSFMSCPPEIRNAIYKHVLSFKAPMVRRKSDTTPMALALLQVNKQIEHEAAPVFYENNVFHFEYTLSEKGSQASGEPLDYEMRRRKGNLSSYDDMQTECPYLDVPKRHVKSLRNVCFLKELEGYWPNGSVVDSVLGAEGLGTVDFAETISWLAARNAILDCISITLRRRGPISRITWDESPTCLLAGLDRDRCISTAVDRFPSLRCFEIWKSRRAAFTSFSPPFEHLEWTAIKPENFDEVRHNHFEKAKAVLYCRRMARGSPFVYDAEGFMIDFQGEGR